MTREQKGVEYEKLVLQGDRVQRDISILQSNNAGTNTKTEAYDKELARLRGIMTGLEGKMNALFVDY